MGNKLDISICVRDKSTNEILEIRKSEEIFTDLGWEGDFIATLARAINNFLKLYGFPAYNKDYVFLESVTLEEYEKLEDYLTEIRNNEQE